jgi:hypothetical protein
MHHFDPPPPPPERHREITVWAICVAILIVPSLLVLFVRGTALALSCAPGPEVCHGLPLGGGLRDALNLAWFIAMDTFLSIAIAFLGALAALKARRPLMAALTMLVLPVLALVLPWLAVFTSLYPDCAPNEEGVGECVLWGAKMGMSVHNAAIAESVVFNIVSYTFALALMIGAIGLLFFRPRDR